MKVLVISTVNPWVEHAGNAYRVRETIDLLLKDNFQVDIFVLSSSNLILNQRSKEKRFGTIDTSGLFKCHSGDSSNFMRKNFQYIGFLSVCRFLKSLAKLKNILLELYRSYKSYGISEVKNELFFLKFKDLIRVSRLLAQENYEVVITNYCFTSGYLLLAVDSLKVIDTHDVFSRKRGMNPKEIVDTSAISEEYETQLLLRGDYVIAIQSNEARILEKMVGSNRVITEMPALKQEHLDFPASFTLGYIASANLYNRYAIKWFLDYVFPQLLRVNPTLRIVIAGPICAALHEDGYVPNALVEYLGEVENVSSFYGKISASINPSSYGTGLKIKVIESINYRRPIFLTQNAAEGINIENPRMVVVCCNIFEWVEKITHFGMSSIVNAEGPEWNFEKSESQLLQLISEKARM